MAPAAAAAADAAGNGTAGATVNDGNNAAAGAR